MQSRGFESLPSGRVAKLVFSLFGNIDVHRINAA